jgi:hypothetical protein
LDPLQWMLFQISSKERQLITNEAMNLHSLAKGI